MMQRVYEFSRDEFLRRLLALKVSPHTISEYTGIAPEGIEAFQRKQSLKSGYFQKNSMELLTQLFCIEMRSKIEKMNGLGVEEIASFYRMDAQDIKALLPISKEVVCL